MQTRKARELHIRLSFPNQRIISTDQALNSANGYPVVKPYREILRRQDHEMTRHRQYPTNDTGPRTRVIAEKAETEYDMRRMELMFLMTAMAVFIVTTGLVVGFHFR